MAKSMGWASKLAMDAALPFDTSSEAFEFISESIQMQIEQIASEGIRGTRSRRGERMQQGLKRIGGTISLNPSQAELDKLLPRILGADESTDVFAVAETLPQFYVMVDRVAKVFQYGPCRVGSASFSGSTGQKILLAINVVAEGDETITNAGSFPSISIDTENCMVFHQGVLTLRGTSTEFDQFTLTIDNAITPTFENSQTATDTATTDRVVTFSCSVPYTSTEADIYANDVAGTIAGATLVFTTGSGKSVTATLNSLRPTTVSPSVGGRDQELRLNLQYQAVATGSTKEISFTNDRTA